MLFNLGYAPGVVIFFIFFRPAFTLLEPVDALNFSLNVSYDAVGVHRRKAIFVFLPPIAWRTQREIKGRPPSMVRHSLWEYQGANAHQYKAYTLIYYSNKN